MAEKMLLYTGGGKGGTGKSYWTIALVQYILKKYPDNGILLFESDNSNPDVGRMYRGTPNIDAKPLILDDKDDGWYQLMNAIDKTDAKTIIINSQAASSEGIKAYGGMLDKAIKNQALQTKVVFRVFWAMSRVQDSIILLHQFLDILQNAPVWPVQNLFFGKKEDFVLYAKDKELQKLIANRGGEVLYMPNLNDNIGLKLGQERVNFDQVLESLDTGYRIGLNFWFNEIKAELDKVFDKHLISEQAKK